MINTNDLKILKQEMLAVWNVVGFDIEPNLDDDLSNQDLLHDLFDLAAIHFSKGGAKVLRRLLDDHSLEELAKDLDKVLKLI